ncbi:hypothetical protein ABIE09_002244 [Lysobacter enzymogenes]|uniref:hypothetical protein n=1 Tax=Lysobacter enzymogenes TaxID=69 RepID=UPI003393DD0E
MKQIPSLRRSALALALLSLSGSALAATCPAYNPSNKANKLYLVFPTANIAYPSFGFTPGSVTNPAAPFSAADLPSYTGTTAALRAAVKHVVELDYCEFNVQVLDTTTLPPTTFARRNTVAVTTKSDIADGLFGLAQAVDTGDATAVDFSYVWGKTYQDWTGGSGGALNGANSTLDRWANSIGGTAAHEAGHNYGLAHNTTLNPGEDTFKHHVMPAGGSLTAEDRAGYRRHFSDTEFSILAANVGLSLQTMWNWDLVNPNANPAHSLEMRVLHPSSTAPSIDWAYAGCNSPWINPTVIGPIGPAETFQGGTYYPYTVKWSTPNPAWGTGSCTGLPGAPGQAPGGILFHIGASFMGVNFNLSTPNPIVIKDITLRDSSSTAMALNPRLHAFDAGTLDTVGNLNLGVFNVAQVPLRLQNLQVRELPRVLGLDQMVANGRMADFAGQEFSPWAKTERTLVQERTSRPGEAISLPVANVSQPRHVYQVITADDCKQGDSFLSGRDVADCKPGTAIDLFPSTTMYFTANSVDDNATYWDPTRREYVRGPLVSRTYYQVTGRRLDRNKNGVDDYIDERQGK